MASNTATATAVGKKYFSPKRREELLRKKQAELRQAKAKLASKKTALAKSKDKPAKTALGNNLSSPDKKIIATAAVSTAAVGGAVLDYLKKDVARMEAAERK